MIKELNRANAKCGLLYWYKILIKTVRSPRSRELFSGFLESAGRELPRGMGVFIDPHYDSGF